MSESDLTAPAAYNELRALLQTLAESSPLAVSWVTVAEVLLQFCRKHQPPAQAWEAVHANLPQSMCDGVTAHIEALLTGGELPATNPREGELAAIVAALDIEFAHDPVYDASFTAALIARGIAGAIDGIYGRTFSKHFQDRGPVHIVADRAFPVANHNPAPLLGDKRPNSRMTSLPSRTLDRTPRLALGRSSATSYPVVLDYALMGRLDLFGSGADFKILACQPNLCLAEFRISPGELDDTISNHGPVNPELQLDLLKNVVTTAVAHEADVVLVPEYCVAESMRQELATFLDDVTDRPLVVVAGSSEVPDRGRAGVHNEAWICVPGEPGRGAQKLFPAHLGDAVEGIVPGTSVHVYVARYFTFAVLICRDSMSEDLLLTLASLGVNLLLVPSFSNRTGTIHASAASLAGRSQAFVAVACAPAVWTQDPAAAAGERLGTDRKEASFAGPYEAHPGLLAVPDQHVGGPVLGRGVWLFRSSFRSVEWLSIQQKSMVDND